MPICYWNFKNTYSMNQKCLRIPTIKLDVDSPLETVIPKLRAELTLFVILATLAYRLVVGDKACVQATP